MCLVALLEQTHPVAQQVAQPPNLRRWHETGIQPAVLPELRDPLAIPFVALAPMQGFHLRWIGQQQIESMPLQGVPDGPLVHAGGLHRDFGDL